MGGGSAQTGKITQKKHSLTKMDQIGFQSQVAEPYDQKTLACERVEQHCGKAGAPVSTSSHIHAVNVVFIFSSLGHLTAFKDAQRTKLDTI